MANDIYGDTLQKVNNSTAVNRMKNLFESPGDKSTSRQSLSSISNTLGSESKFSHSKFSNGNVPLLPAKEKSRTYLNAENSKSSSCLGSKTWTSDVLQSRSSNIKSASSSSLLKNTKEPDLKSDSAIIKDKGDSSKMETDNIPPWKRELLERKKNQEQQNGVAGNSTETKTEEKKPLNVTPSKFTPGVVKPLNIFPKSEDKDVNSNSITSPDGKKRDSKLEIPNIFKKEEDTSVTPSKSPKPKPPVTPRKPVTEGKSAEGSEVASKFSPNKFKSTSGTNIQDELASKLAKRNRIESDTNDSAPEVTVNKLNKDSINLLERKLSGQTDKSGENKEDDSKVVLRQNFEGDKKITPKRKSVIRKSLTRHVDGHKFYIVDIEKTKTFVKAPSLPDKLEITDLQRLQEIIREYKAALAELEGVAEDLSGGGVTEDADEIYEDIPADMDDEFPPPPPSNSTPSRPRLSRSSRAVSLIKPMSEDEEGEDEIYDDTVIDLPPPPDELLRPPVPEAPRPAVPSRKQPPAPPKSPVPSEKSATEDTEELYDDTVVGKEDDQEIYEPIMGEEEDETNSSKSSEQLQEDKPETPQDKKKKDREEKEKKKAEKKKQEEEKKRQMEEKKQLKNLKKTFNIEPFELDNVQAEGTIKTDTPAKPGKTDLVAKSGQRIKIIRMVDNPKGKWLVKLSENGKVGYIDSNNVEVENQLIRNVMEGSYMNSFNADDEEEYADCDMGDAPVAEELYEAV